MKLKNLLLLIFAILICSTTYAGFLVKKQKQHIATTTTNNTIAVPTNKELRKEQRLQNLNTLKAYLLAQSDGRDTKKGHSHGSGAGWEGIVSLVCGILSFVGFGVPVLILLCIPAIIFGILGLNKPHKGMALAGLILGSIALLILILAIIILAVLLSAIF